MAAYQRLTGGAACVAAALLVGACGGRDVGPFRDASVVLISIDTLRADHLPAYGYAAGTTPAIDALAREGVQAGSQGRVDLSTYQWWPDGQMTRRLGLPLEAMAALAASRRARRASRRSR